jgi:hypothetical protein
VKNLEGSTVVVWFRGFGARGGLEVEVKRLRENRASIVDVARMGRLHAE